MKITCEKCSAYYEVDDSRIPVEGLTMKCPRCLASFSVKRPGAPASSTAAAATPATRYYLRRRTGKVFGPFLERAIASMLEQQKLDGDEDISVDGQSWRPLAQVPALASFVRSPAATLKGMPVRDVASMPQPGRADLADLPAPKGSLDALADLPAPKRAVDAISDLASFKGGLDVTDLPAPKGGVEIADLPAPKNVQPGTPGFNLQGFDPGEFDLSSLEHTPEGMSVQARRPDAYDQPARPPASPPKRATGLEYGEIEFTADGEAELTDLPAPKELPDLPAPKSPSDLPAPKRPSDMYGAAEPPDLLQPKPAEDDAPPPDFGVLDLPRPKGPPPPQPDFSSEVGELDDLPVSAGGSAGPIVDSDAFDLPAPGRPFETPDLLAPRQPAADEAQIVDVVAPKRPLPEITEAEEEAGEMVTFAAPSQEALEAAGAPELQYAEEIDLPQEEEAMPEVARRPGRLRRIKPLWIAAGAGVFVLVLGLCLGLLTDYGFFGSRLITGEHAKRQKAKKRVSAAVAALRADTYRGYSQAADELEQAARVLDEPEPWALEAQAVAALEHRFGPNPSRRTQLDVAVSRLNKLEDKSPDGDKARALAQLAGGQFEAASTALKRISDQEPGDLMAALYFGWARLAAKDPRSAVPAFARVLAAQPPLPGALFGTADAHWALRDTKSCEIWTDKTLAAAPDHAGALLLKARLLLTSGKALQAKPLLNKVLAQQAGPPELSMARTLLGELAIAGGQVNEARLLLVEAVRLDQRNGRAHLLMGRLYFDARQYSEAQRLFERARQLDPADLQAAAMLARTDIAMNLPVEAQKVVQDLIKAAPGDPEVIYVQGLLDETMGKLDTASELFKTLISRVPDRLDGYHHLAKINLRLKKLEEAQKLLQQAEAKVPLSAALRAAQGEVLYLSGKPELARLRLEQALQMEPNNNLATFLLASVIIDQGHMEQARERLVELKKRDKAYPGAAARLGEVYIHLKEPVKAAAEYDQALTEENPSPAVRLGAARAYLDSGKIDKALEQCARVLETDFASAAAGRALMAEARFKQNRSDEALIEIQRALEREKKAGYLILLGRIQEARKRSAEALEAYSEALKLESTNKEIRMRRAVLLVQNGVVKDGLKEMKAIIAASPNSGDAYFYLGVAQRGLGQEAEALRSWTMALTKSPNHAEAHFRIAEILAETQRGAQALTHFEAAVKNAQPGDQWLPDAYYNLGKLQQEHNQKKNAIESLQKYLELAPLRSGVRSDARKRLEQLGVSTKRE